MGAIEVKRAIAIFYDLDPNIRTIFTKRCVARTLRENERFFFQRPDLGMIPRNSRAFFVRHGAVRLLAEDQGEIVRIAEGEAFADFSEKRFSGAVLAETNSELCVTNRRDFDLLLEAHPKFLSSLLVSFATSLYETQEELADARADDAASRILRELVREGSSQEPDGSLLLPYLTHEVIAKRVGLARETVSRTFSRLMSLGALKRLPGKAGYLLRNNR